MKRKVIFLDRDGVINKDTGYLHRIKDLQWFTGAKVGLKKAHQAGFDLIIITNQSGVARGYYSETDVAILHEYMSRELERIGAPILAIYYCPHLKGASIAKYDKECDCRKPKPGMILKAFADFDIDRAQSFLIGDSPRDIEAAEAAGIKGYLFTGDDLEIFITSLI